METFLIIFQSTLQSRADYYIRNIIIRVTDGKVKIHEVWAKLHRM